MPKAYVFTRFGGPQTEALVDLERPRPGPAADLVVRGDLNPHVTGRYPLERAGEALREVESGHARGKVVLEIGAGA
ncbi:zinc-binding dehydrogenase [Streptomyces sp. NPDC058291]|jgi:NADPH:quinone reductase-like Zn-dependent oxidoreductase|uniref:zinc-binding dehydrogenase n=1 Tax=Streptomyces sp. NPDC058291 TaxID=3346427 RepID=UPI0036E8FC01